MFFLEAGSYVLPKRNENKAPKGSSGSLGTVLRCYSTVSPARRSSVWSSEDVGKSGTGRSLSGAEQISCPPWPRDSTVAPSSLRSPACSVLLAAPAYFSDSLQRQKGTWEWPRQTWNSNLGSELMKVCPWTNYFSPLCSRSYTMYSGLFFPLLHTFLHSSLLAPLPPWPGSGKAIYSKSFTKWVKVSKQHGSVKRSPKAFQRRREGGIPAQNVIGSGLVLPGQSTLTQDRSINSLY